MGTLWQDVKYSLRIMAKNPGFTLVAVLAIALGIGTNTTIFSAVNALMLRPFSFSNQDRLVMVWERSRQTATGRGSVAPANFLDWREQSQVFEQLAAFKNQSFNLTGGDQPERIEGTLVTTNFFATLGVKALRGRTFSEEEGAVGHNQVVILKESLWKRRFAADPNIIGKTIALNGKSYSVVGVMPQDFEFPLNGGEMWSPVAFTPEQQKERRNHDFQVMGLLKPNATIEQAQDETARIYQRAADEYPETNAGRTTWVESLTASYTRGSHQYLIVLMGAVGFVLLIACANVANLLLVRGVARQKEIAVRTALGASRWRLIRQLLTESIVLSLISSVFGLLIAVWGIEFLSRGIPPTFTKYIPGWRNLGLDGWVLGFTFLASIVTGLIFGIVPALSTTKTNLNEALKESARSVSGSLGRNRMRSFMVIAEVALSLVLLIGAGLMIRSFIELLRVDTGFNASQVLTLDLALPNAKYAEEQQRINFYRQLLERVSTLPGVESVGVISHMPMSRSGSDTYFTVEGRLAPEHGREPAADYRVVSSGFFNSLMIPLRGGRLFTEQDNLSAPRKVLVNETLARRFFPEGDALGKRLVIWNEPWEIVGVVGDIKYSDLDDPTDPAIYFSYLQNPLWNMSLSVRTKSEPTALTAAVEQEVHALDKDQPVFNVRTVESLVDEGLAPKRLATLMLAFFAAIALVLASIGIYAVMSYTVTQRTHEIGIRMALGAQTGDILRMMIGQGIVLVSIGICLGLAGSLLLTRVMSKILYNVTSTDPVTFISLSLLLSAVAVVASFIPARRATKVDPMTALRYE